MTTVKSMNPYKHDDRDEKSQKREKGRIMPPKVWCPLPIMFSVVAIRTCSRIRFRSSSSSMLKPSSAGDVRPNLHVITLASRMIVFLLPVQPALGPASAVRASHHFVSLKPFVEQVISCRAVPCPRDLSKPNPPTAVDQHANEPRPCASVGSFRERGGSNVGDVLLPGRSQVVRATSPVCSDFAFKQRRQPVSSDHRRFASL